MIVLVALLALALVALGLVLVIRERHHRAAPAAPALSTIEPATEQFPPFLAVPAQAFAPDVERTGPYSLPGRHAAEDRNEQSVVMSLAEIRAEMARRDRAAGLVDVDAVSAQ